MSTSIAYIGVKKC